MWNDIWHTHLFELGDGRSIEVSQVVLAALTFVIGLVISAFLSRLMARSLVRRRVTPGAAQALQRVVFYTLLVTVVLTALHLLHIPLTMFAFLGGALAIGVGFGAQSIVNNFISGWILVAERQVRVHDLVEVDTHLGMVETIGNRCMRVRRTDGVDVLVPNSVVLERTMLNWTLTDRHIRTQVRVGVQYGSPAGEVASLIQRAVDEQDDVLKDPTPVVIFDDFGDNALMFDVYFWVAASSEMELRKARSAVRFRVDELFRASEIVISYPQRDLHLDTLAPLEVKVVASDAGASTAQV